MTAIIINSVGRAGKNNSVDVKIIQELINMVLKNKTLVVDGNFGRNTLNKIILVQKDIVKMLRPDGLISPKGKTIRALNCQGKGSKESQPLVINYRKNARHELSPYTKDVLRVAMTFADVRVIEISSTRRLIEDQVRIMHDQLSRAKKNGVPVRQIRGYGYSAPGRAVDKVYYDYADKLTEAEVNEKMIEEVKKWLKEGKRVSKHVVTESAYHQLNVLDVPYSSVPLSKRDEFEQALVSISADVQSRNYSKNKDIVDVLGKNMIDLLIIERRCWHMEISQFNQALPNINPQDMRAYC